MRRLLALGLAVALGLAPGARAEEAAIDVVATPIGRFDLGTPVGASFGALVFLGGLQLRGRDADFGGLSGLRLSEDGSRFIAISDRGNWFRGSISYDGSRPVDVSNLTIEPTPGRDGLPLHGRRGFDTEGLEVQGRTAWVSAEKVNWLTRYALDADDRPDGKGVPVDLPPAARKAPFNEGYEAIAATSSGSMILVAASDCHVAPP